MAHHSNSLIHQMLQACQQTQVGSTKTQQTQSPKEPKPAPKYDPTEDAHALDKAMKSKPVDIGTIIDIITKRNNDQRQHIRDAYQKDTKKSLDEALKAALSGDLEEVILALVKTPAEYDASELKKAMKGFGTDEDCLIEILASRTNKEIKLVNKAYETAFKTTLDKDITADTSGDFLKALLILQKGERPEDCYANQEYADKDTKALIQAGEKSQKPDVSVFIIVLTGRSIPHLRKVFELYGKYSSHNLNDAIELELKGDIEALLIAVVKCAVSTPKFFAEKLHLAMKGSGANKKILTRIMVSRSEKDMKDIKAEYRKITGKSLRDSLMEETKDDYQTVLMALCGYD